MNLTGKNFIGNEKSAKGYLTFNAVNPATTKDTKPLNTQLLRYKKFREARKAFEREYINRKLIENNQNVTQTAEAIGVGRSYLHRKIKSFK